MLLGILGVKLLSINAMKKHLCRILGWSRNRSTNWLKNGSDSLIQYLIASATVLVGFCGDSCLSSKHTHN